MKKFTLYVGLNDKDQKVQIIDTLEAAKICQNLVSNLGGGTIYNAYGVYRHDDGTVIVENTLRIEIFEFSDPMQDQIKSLVGTLKKILNQESIAVQIEDVISELW